jgi:hypothetical protein
VDRSEIERTSEQVRRILEAAEASADQIRAQAADDVARLRSRLAEVESDLGGVVETLRRSGDRLADALAPPPDEAPVDAVVPLDGDEAGARLTALNMALGGTPREETARYLAEHYALADPEALLDDVYDRAGA